MSARSSLQTQDTAAGLTALLWNVDCCFSMHSPAHNKTPPICSLSNISPDVSEPNARHAANAASTRQPWREETQVSSPLQPHPMTVLVSKSFRETGSNRKRETERKRDCVRQAGFWGLLLCFLSMLNCSNFARGSPQGLQTVWALPTSQSGEETKFTHQQQRRELNANFRAELTHLRVFQSIFFFFGDPPLQNIF